MLDMSKTITPLILKTTKAGPGDADVPLIAGSKRVFNHLKDEGYDPVNPDALLDEADQLQILSQMAELARILAGYFENLGFDPGGSDAVSARAVRNGFSALAFDKVVGKMGGLTPVDHIASVFSPRLKTIKPNPVSRILNSVGFYLDDKLLFNGEYVLDFSSQSGKKLTGATTENIVRPISTRSKYLGADIQFHNKLQYLKKFKPGQRVRYKIAEAMGDQEFDIDLKTLAQKISRVTGPQIADMLAVEIANGFQEIELAKNSLNNWLSAVSNKPDLARFNNFGSSELSGFGLALQQNGVPVEVKSHGALIAHGSADRMEVTSLFSRAIYNEPSCATTLVPRSPLQVATPEYKSKIIAKPLIKPQAERIETGSQHERAFRVYLAPNFLSWFACYHGMSQSCFEAEQCIRTIAAAVANRRDIELFVRIKTTTNDVARKNLKQPTRGLLPQDVRDLIEAQKGIYDASTGSHSELLENADLVITEGATAVMFEALEFRKPVLFVNRFASREPSLPSTRMQGGQPPKKRSATYCTSFSDGLEEVLGTIKVLHQDKPLEDGELEGLVWV